MDWIIGKALELIREAPLCDRCLGRMFARLGMGLSNKERGRALKTLITMEFHRRIREGDEEALEEFRMLASRLGDPGANLYRHLFGEEVGEETCVICRGALDRVIEEAIARGSELVKKYDAPNFLVGCVAPRSLINAEERLKTKHGLVYAESIKAEVRREVGKGISKATGIQPEFSEPKLLLIVDMALETVIPNPMPLLLKGRYWKLGRRISQSLWITPVGKKYPFSVEEALKPIAEAVGSERAILHAAGREDVDARMLGTGRPMIIEVKNPSRLRINTGDAENLVNSSQGLVRIRIEGPATRSDVRLYKSEKARTVKHYRALVFCEDPVETGDLERLLEELRGARVRQQTPRRVLHRRADATRYRRIYDIAVKRLSPRVLEALIEAEGGLYIKELISGDEGRTEPSFSEILGTRCRCVSLDVVGVELGGGELSL